MDQRHTTEEALAVCLEQLDSGHTLAGALGACPEAGPEVVASALLAARLRATPPPPVDQAWLSESRARFLERVAERLDPAG